MTQYTLLKAIISMHEAYTHAPTSKAFTQAIASARDCFKQLDKQLESDPTGNCAGLRAAQDAVYLLTHERNENEKSELR